MDLHEHYCQLATDITKQLVVEWQKEPFRWEREIEIQSELFIRLNTAFQLIGKSFITHSTGKAPRVAAEPNIYRDDAKYPCKPDIVIRDEVDMIPPSGDHWPLIWVCELKFCPFYQAVDSNPDIPKVRAFIEQKKTRFGCCVRLFHRSMTPGHEFGWKCDDQIAGLSTCDAFAERDI